VIIHRLKLLLGMFFFKPHRGIKEDPAFRQSWNTSLRRQDLEGIGDDRRYNRRPGCVGQPCVTIIKFSERTVSGARAFRENADGVPL
jgi:hypothetical protein